MIQEMLPLDQALHVAHYKIQRRFIRVEDLPRTATGKILKKESRKTYRETEVKRPS